MLVTRFMLGLEDAIRALVMVQLPDTVQQGSTIALVQEEVLAIGLVKHKKFTARTETSSSSPVVEQTGQIFEKGELWKPSN
ncbi:hypothetical protein E2562_004140 [Oryza meyeriana var. granulata]|uniref:Uncharacterized protein n=1 Tax=Oryza meyeriana var. granulata TaxID=110450 RepID=A0A6G1EV39_9ORYZ|nr:hypothetical protein E2562_004140 [Oryza meyeriana var. granulata]